jgi:hypothetical protein
VKSRPLYEGLNSAPQAACGRRLLSGRLDLNAKQIRPITIRNLHHIAIACALASLASCQAEVYVSSPVVVKVVDSSTGQVIPGVRVMVETLEDPRVQSSGETGPDGEVRLSRMTGHYTYFLPVDRIFGPVLLRFEKASYLSTEVKCLRCDDGAEVRMTPLAAR